MFHCEAPQHHCSIAINSKRTVAHSWCLRTEHFQHYVVTFTEAELLVHTEWNGGRHEDLKSISTVLLLDCPRAEPLSVLQFYCPASHKGSYFVQTLAVLCAHSNFVYYHRKC